MAIGAATACPPDPTSPTSATAKASATARSSLERLSQGRKPLPSSQGRSTSGDACKRQSDSRGAHQLEIAGPAPPTMAQPQWSAGSGAPASRRHFRIQSAIRSGAIVFVDFLYELRRCGVRVGAQEALALAQALAQRLHGESLDGFYDVAKAVLVHRTEDLDGFDAAFASYFHGVALESVQVTDQLLEWLKDPVARRELSDEEKELLEILDLDELRRRFLERLAEQRGRHDRGSRWIGTGGTSPFGRGGYHPSGLSVGDGAPSPTAGAGSAVARAALRSHHALRGDRTVDVRQIGLALRRLRAFVREGALTELDLEASIDATARNAGELE